MRDDQLIAAIEAEIVAALSTPAIPDVAAVLPSMTPEDLVFRDLQGQLPGIGVAEVELVPRAGPTGSPHLGMGTKAYRGTSSWNITTAVFDESDSRVEGRNRCRAIWGEILKRLVHLQSTATGGMRYRFLGLSYPDQPNPALIVTISRFELDGVFGKE